MTLTYTGDGGQPQEKTVFFKLNADDSRERDTYSYLAQLGVPVPRLVLQLDHADHEVLGLEFLPSVGVRPDDVDPLLRLTASLNAATDVPRPSRRPAVACPRTSSSSSSRPPSSRWPHGGPSTDRHRGSISTAGLSTFTGLCLVP
jgi:hypothetical protein